MELFDRAAGLMAEVGPLGAFANVVEFAAERFWQIQVSEELDVFVELDAENELLAFEARVGTPAADNASGLHRRLLEYNRMWSDTGGVSAALDPDGAVLLLWRAPLKNADARGVAGAILTFSEKVMLWRQIIAEPDPSEERADENRIYDGMLIRA